MAGALLLQRATERQQRKIHLITGEGKKQYEPSPMVSKAAGYVISHICTLLHVCLLQCESAEATLNVK